MRTLPADDRTSDVERSEPSTGRLVEDRAQRGAARFRRSPRLAARWDAALGEYILDWNDVRSADDPHQTALQFGRSAVRHACTVCGWDASLAESADGRLPPIV